MNVHQISSLRAPRRAPHSRRRGQSYIGILVGGILLLALGWMLLGRGQKVDGTPKRSVAKRAIDRGQSVNTASNISQIQQFIEMYKNDNDGKPPVSYAELRKSAHDYPAEMWVDGVSGKPLIYDPASGRIMVPAGSNANVPAAGAPGAVPNAIPGIPGLDKLQVPPSASESDIQ